MKHSLYWVFHCKDTKMRFGSPLLQTTTATTTLSARGIRRNWRHIFNPADLHARTGQSAKSRLRSWSWSLGPVTASSPQLDVQSSDAQQLALLSYILEIEAKDIHYTEK